MNSLAATGRQLSLPKYAIGVAAIFLAVLVPYLFPVGEVEGYLIVYGVPIVVVSLLFGQQIFSKAAKNNVEAFKLTLGSYGGFYLIGLFVATVVLILIIQLDPSAEQLLQKPNPALDVTPDVAVVMMVVSMLVVGPAEEYLFRGFMYGGMLNLSKGRHWFSLAVASAIMFALAHGYYFIVYGSASPVFFIQLTAFGSAMAVAYHWSGGNLIAPAVVHGLNDLIGFLGVATTRTTALAAQGVFIAISAIFAVYILLKKVRINPTRQPGPTPQEEQPQPPKLA